MVNQAINRQKTLLVNRLCPLTSKCRSRVKKLRELLTLRAKCERKKRETLIMRDIILHTPFCLVTISTSVFTFGETGV